MVPLKSSIVSFDDTKVYFGFFFFGALKFMRNDMLPSYYKISCHMFMKFW